MNKKLIVAILLTLIPLAAAYATLTVDPVKQDIPIGTDGSYKVTLVTDNSGPSHMEWITDDSKILAVIGPVGGPFGSMSQAGSYAFNAVAGVQIFELRVSPQPGVIVNTEYDISTIFKHDKKGVKAVVTASANPTPEMPTVALLGTGLVGLIGIARYRRKD